MIGRVVVVTGTSTDVGKTIASAALAATARGSVIVVKPVQTGVGDGAAGDVDVVHALTGSSVQELFTLDEPLAPETAGRRAGVRLRPWPSTSTGCARWPTCTTPSSSRAPAD